MAEPLCPICKRQNKDVKMKEDGRGTTATLGHVLYWKCGVCGCRLPTRSKRNTTLPGMGPKGGKHGP